MMISAPSVQSLVISLSFIFNRERNLLHPNTKIPHFVRYDIPVDIYPVS